MSVLRKLRDVAPTLLALVATAAASISWPQLRTTAVAVMPRQLQQRPSSGKCRAVALRLMPTPSIRAYEMCFSAKMRPNSSHDWSVPGAEVNAQLQCWCQHNLTATMQDYGCCDHDDVYPMCSVKCAADCNSALAKECVKACPSMCFEAAEYVVDSSLCSKCSWVKCWPVLKCLTTHAITRIENGTLARTCHEMDFRAKPQLQKYHQCWQDAPKHSSHWNVLSSIVNCICREGMQAVTKETSCCDSVPYSAGTCDLKCLSEKECVSQTAQTCIHGCQMKCPSMQMTPSEACMKHCLAKDAPCRKYVSCRPPYQSKFICDDGRWPQADSGCCVNPRTFVIGCPRLCESERIWRLDRRKGIPWWARWKTSPGIVAQCTCGGCPSSEAKAQVKLKKTVAEGLWDNGQIMLVDIARREGLKYGPNRRMQELMLNRNSEIKAISKMRNTTANALDRRIAAINDRYISAIVTAAREYPDTPFIVSVERDRGKKNQNTRLIGLIVICTLCIIAAVACATCLIVRLRRKQNTITQFQHGDHVVVGNPVQAGSEFVAGTVQGGTAVTLTAPMKTTNSPKTNGSGG